MKESPTALGAPHVDRKHTPRDLLNNLARRFGLGAFGVSLLVHALFILAAIFLFYRLISPPEPPIEFVPGGGGGGGSSGAAESVKARSAMRKTMMSTSSVERRIASDSLNATFTLPDVSTDLQDPGIPLNMGGGVAGSGLGSGGGDGTGIGQGTGPGTGPGSGPGRGRGFVAPTPFGSRGEGATGLVGTFIDFKLKPNGKPTGADPSMGNYNKILQDFKRSGWKSQRFPHYSPETTLTAKFFSFPVMQDRLAGPAFGSTDSGPGLWVAHYRGRITASVPGKYRFVGYGDNVLAVKIGGKLVLDACNLGVFGDAHEEVGKGTDHMTRALPIFAGDWVNLSKFEQEIEVIIGDQGGVFCAGLYIQPEKNSLTIENGFPKLPLFLTGPVTDEERKLLQLVPAESLNGPYFPTKDSSRFDRLDRDL